MCKLFVNSDSEPLENCHALWLAIDGMVTSIRLGKVFFGLLLEEIAQRDKLMLCLK